MSWVNYFIPSKKERNLATECYCTNIHGSLSRAGWDSCDFCQPTLLLSWNKLFWDVHLVPEVPPAWGTHQVYNFWSHIKAFRILDAHEYNILQIFLVSSWFYFSHFEAPWFISLHWLEKCPAWIDWWHQKQKSQDKNVERHRDLNLTHTNRMPKLYRLRHHHCLEIFSCWEKNVAQKDQLFHLCPVPLSISLIDL